MQYDTDMVEQQGLGSTDNNDIRLTDAFDKDCIRDTVSEEKGDK